MAKTALVVLGKVLLLTIVAMGINVLVGLLVPIPASFSIPPAETQTAALVALGLFFVFSILFYAAAVQSQQYGWRLYLALLSIYAGFQVVMTQVETLIFLPAFTQLTRLDVGQMVLNSLLCIALYLAVLITLAGRWRRPADVEHRRGIALPTGLVWKVLLLALVYPVVYFVFGYVIAWQFEAVRAYYATTPAVYDLPILAAIQVLRGAAWVLFGLPIFTLFDKPGRTVLFAMLFYALLPSLVLLHPNPLMPAAVRYPHLLEMTSSMALFGLIASAVMLGGRLWSRDMGRPRMSSVGGHA